MLISPDKVKEISDALATVTEESFRSRFDLTAFEETKVYPGGDWADPDVIPWLWKTFGEVRDFYQDAAYFSDAMLFYLT